MRWALFQSVMQKLVSVRELDPARDAAGYAEQLLILHPSLFARVEGGSGSVRARMAARTIAIDHLTEVCRLPAYVEALERSLGIATMSPGTRLVRVAALAYLLCGHDLYPDGLPAGYVLVDDCIAMRGAMLATPGRQQSGSSLLAELLSVRYLALALPSQVLRATEAALTYSAQLAARTRGMPKHLVEGAIRQLIQDPPAKFPAELPLPDDEAPIEIEAVLRLLPAALIHVEGEILVFEFPDGSRLRREPGGVLYDA
jgi:hypothetical protein